MFFDEVKVLFGQCPNRRRCGIELVDLMLCHYIPKTAKIWIGGNPFEHEGCSPVRQGSINDVGVAGNPANICRTPVHILFPILEYVLEGIGGVDHITGSGMDHTLRFSGRAGSI